MNDTGTESEPPGLVLSRHSRPRTENRIRLAFVSDIHLTESGEGTWKVLHRTAERYQQALRDINERDIDFVQFLGDLTHGGSPEDVERFSRLREILECPSSVIPGNHDVPKNYRTEDHLEFQEFRNRFQISDFPTRESINNITVIGLNSAYQQDGTLDSNWSGKIGEKQRDRLEMILASAENPIVCLHHNLGPLPEHPRESPWTWFPAKDGKLIIELLNQYDVPLAISGHHHVPTVVTRGSVREILSPAICSFPQSYLIMSVNSNGTTVSLIPLAGKAGMKEAYWAANKGDAIGKGVLDIVSERLANDE